MEKEKGFKYLVRIAQTDIEGSKKIMFGLRKIKGINTMYSNLVCRLADVELDSITGKLSEIQIKRLEDVIFNPMKYGAPEWILNRKKDPETGETKHILTTDLRFSQENDIKQMRKIKTYRGTRHSYGLPSRGQKTKSNFRKSKGKAMGVQKKKKK